MKICAVVVTYNRKELLEKQIIEILHNQELKIDAYYVIDNCSTDGTRSLVKEYEGTVIKYCKTKVIVAVPVDFLTDCSELLRINMIGTF